MKCQIPVPNSKIHCLNIGLIASLQYMHGCTISFELSKSKEFPREDKKEADTLLRYIGKEHLQLCSFENNEKV